MCGLLQGVLDLTPGDGSFGKAAIENNVIYVAVCFNEAHMILLKEQIISFVLDRMGAEDGKELYDARYASHKKSATPKAAGAAPPNPTKPKRAPKRKLDDDKKKSKKDKKKKKGKKSESSSSSSSSASDSHSAE